MTCRQNSAYAQLAKREGARPLGNAARLYQEMIDVQTPCPAAPLLDLYPRDHLAHANQERRTRTLVAAPLVTVQS